LHGGPLDTARVDGDGRSRCARGLTEEGGFALIGFDQIEWHSGGNRKNEARETGAAAEVDSPGGRREEGDKLQAVIDMALPKHREVTGRDQVYGFAPASEQCGEGGETGLGGL
jgi:hypothetical protein